MGRGRKVLIGVAGALAALVLLLLLNQLVTEGETKAAEVNVPGGRILELPGGDLQVVEGGPRDGSPIVLVHCFTCAIDWWDAMRPALERKHRVVAVDLLGFGGSEKPGSGYSIEEQADLVADALDRLGVRDATVVGHSLGGTVSGALAERSPELVERLVIIDQAPNNNDYGDGLPFTAELTFMPLVGPALWRVVPDDQIKEGLSRAFAPGYDVPDAFVEDFKRETYTSYDQGGEAEDTFLDAEPLDDRVEATGVPLLAIFGDEEQIYDPQKALDAYARVRGAKTVMVDGAGHSPNVEKPLQTAALVNWFARRPVELTTREVQDVVQNRKPVRPRP